MQFTTISETSQLANIAYFLKVRKGSLVEVRRYKSVLWVRFSSGGCSFVSLKALESANIQADRNLVANGYSLFNRASNYRSTEFARSLAASNANTALPEHQKRPVRFNNVNIA